MTSFAHGHGSEHAHETRGRLLDRGWRYDLQVWFIDTFVLHGQVRGLRRKVLDLAELRVGQSVLDVGCGTGRSRSKPSPAWVPRVAWPASIPPPGRSRERGPRRHGLASPSISNWRRSRRCRFLTLPSTW